MPKDNYCHFLSNFPEEILLQILPNLPAKPLIQLRCVSKLYNSLVAQPHFLKLHFSSITTQPCRHHLFHITDENPNFFFTHQDSQETINVCRSIEYVVKFKLSVVGSARGVLCLSNFISFKTIGHVVLWNPTIQKRIATPPFYQIGSFSKRFSCTADGFGYDDVNLDFKVVKILYDPSKRYPEFQGIAWVYEIKVGSWRCIEQDVPCYMSQESLSSFLVNRVVYWPANKEYPLVDWGPPDCFMAFDLAEEVCGVVEFPDGWEAAERCQFSVSPDEKSIIMFVSHFEDLKKWKVWETSMFI